MSTNWHPSEEDLILHFYAESDAVSGGRIDTHLGSCPSCHAAWTELGETLKLVDRAAMPEPGPGFERVMWARVQQALPPRRAAWSVRVWLPVAASLMVAGFAGMYAWRMSHRAAPTVPADEPPPVVKTAESRPEANKLGERVLLTALDDHFQQAQMLLVELKNSSEGAGDFDFERTTADDLISSGRLYRIAARQHGERQFAQTLDDLESVLIDVARSGQSTRPEALKALRARIESQDLLLKVRAATKQVHERQKTLLTAAANE